MGHAPPVPYPITLRDLQEPGPPKAAERLGPQFKIPSLHSLAPDPVAVEFSERRQIVRADLLEQSVPVMLEDGFHGSVGGNGSGEIEVSVVIERLFTGCYPVRVGGLERGQHSFVEAWIDLGTAGGDRVRFAVHEEYCTSADDAMTRLGTGLAALTVAVSERVE